MATTTTAATNAAFRKQLNKVYAFYTGGFIAFVIILAVLEQLGLNREWIGFIFLMATIGLYAGIGIMSRTTDATEYYVAGRRVPAIFNGMATGADWMSAASFIGMAGTLYLRATAAWRSSWGGRVATSSWHCSSRPTCASSGSSRFPTSSARATAATCRASSASSRRSSARSPTWSRRSTASASSPAG